MNRALVFVFFCTVLFSTMEVALKGMVGSFGAMQVNITRFLIGGLALIPFALRGVRQSGERLDAGALGRMALLGFVGIAVSMTLYQLAVERVPANVAAVIFCCNSAFVMGFAFLIMKTPITRRQAASLALALLGIACIVNPLRLGISVEGAVLSLSAPVLFALYVVLGAPVSHRFSGVTTTCGSFLFGSLELMALALIAQLPPVTAFLDAHGLEAFANVTLTGGYSSARDVLLMLYVSVGVSGAGYACYFMAAEAGSPFTASLAFFFKPVLAPVLAVLFLNETISATTLAGIALILVGSVLTMRARIEELAHWYWLRHRLAQHHHDRASFRIPDHHAGHYHGPRH